MAPERTELEALASTMLATFKMQKLRLALRQLGKSRGFTTVAVVTLALGIGVTTAMYSVVRGVMLRPLAVEDQETLVVLWQTHSERGINRFSQSIPNFFDYREQATSFAGMMAYRDSSAKARLRDDAVRLAGLEVTSGYMQVLGWKPILGRGFLDEEDVPGAPRVVMVSESLWREQFDADPAVLGRSFEIDGQPHQIVGVLGRQASGLSENADFWRPLAASPRSDGRDNHMLTVMGRLKEGVSLNQAESELRVIAERFPKIDPGYTGWSVRLERLYDVVVPPQLRRALAALLVGVGCVLLVACLNVANLLLARALSRGREVAVRLALGATRRHLIAQVMAETAILVLIGGVAGVMIAWWAVHLTRTAELRGIPRSDELGIDGNGLLFAVAVCLLVALVTGILPALRSSKGHPAVALAGGGRSVGISRHGHRTRFALVSLQIALSCVLLVGAGLLVKSFHRLQGVDPGFTARGILTFAITPDQSHYGEERRRLQFYERLTDELKGIPGVAGVGMTSAAPFGPGATSLNVLSTDPSALKSGESLQASWRIVSPDYFETMRIPLIEGRTYTRFDTTHADKVVIISERLARTLWPSESAIGKRLSPGSLDNLYTVVGVVGETRMQTLSGTDRPAMYFSVGQWWGWGTMTFVVRANVPSEVLALAIRARVRKVDPAQPVFNFSTAEQFVSVQLQSPRLNSWLLGTFAGIALVLAAVGLYGVIASAVGERIKEFGTRMALGAQPADIARLVLVGGGRLVATGLLAGLALALASTRVIQSMLFEVPSNDPSVFCIVSAILALVAMFACWLPARRAAKVNPVEVLGID